METERIGIRIDPELKKLLEEQAKENGMPLSRWVKYVLKKQIPVSKLVISRLKL